LKSVTEDEPDVEVLYSAKMRRAMVKPTPKAMMMPKFYKRRDEIIL
jgi:hypothetical protein